MLIGICRIPGRRVVTEEIKSARPPARDRVGPEPLYRQTRFAAPDGVAGGQMVGVGMGGPLPARRGVPGPLAVPAAAAPAGRGRETARASDRRRSRTAFPALPGRTPGAREARRGRERLLGPPRPG